MESGGGLGVVIDEQAPGEQLGVFVRRARHGQGTYDRTTPDVPRELRAERTNVSPTEGETNFR